jgi:hypothetical protein
VFYQKIQYFVNQTIRLIQNLNKREQIYQLRVEICTIRANFLSEDYRRESSEKGIANFTNVQSKIILNVDDYG